ncbi:MAG TPA: hypothetical protein VNX88_16625 [Terriglobales bacterium]|nr:hypothetical protein [Terriglobales bacterium]
MSITFIAKAPFVDEGILAIDRVMQLWVDIGVFVGYGKDLWK